MSFLGLITKKEYDKKVNELEDKLIKICPHKEVRFTKSSFKQVAYLTYEPPHWTCEVCGARFYDEENIVGKIEIKDNVKEIHRRNKI